MGTMRFEIEPHETDDPVVLSLKKRLDGVSVVAQRGGDASQNYLLTFRVDGTLMRHSGVNPHFGFQLNESAEIKEYG